MIPNKQKTTCEISIPRILFKLLQYNDKPVLTLIGWSASLSSRKQSKVKKYKLIPP